MFPKLLESKEVRADIARYQNIIDKITAVNSKSQMEDALHKYVQKLNEMDMWHTAENAKAIDAASLQDVRDELVSLRMTLDRFVIDFKSS